MQDQTPHRSVTRERQQLAELEAEFREVERQQEERFDLIRRKHARLAQMGITLDD